MHQHCIHAISRRLVRASIAAAMLLFLPLASLTTVALAAIASPAISALPAGSDPQLAQIIVQDNKGAPMTGAIARVLVVPQNMAANPQITEPVAGTGTIDA